MKAVVIREKVQFEEIINLQEGLGGWLESLAVGEDFTVFIDEDGKSKNLPFNPIADRIIREMLANNGRTLMPGDQIVGPAIFVGLDDAGNEIELPQWVVDQYFKELK